MFHTQSVLGRNGLKLVGTVDVCRSSIAFPSVSRAVLNIRETEV